MARKMKLGRRKIQIQMILDKDARQVAFSKRRSGLFKKANELCTLTGCEIGIIVFSPGGKPFSFGHPCVDSIRKRFLGQSPMLVADNQDSHSVIASALNQKYTDLRDQIEAEKKQGEMLKEMLKESRKRCWLEAPIDELNLNELMISKMLMEDLRKKISKQLLELSFKDSTSKPFLAVNSVGAIDLNVANPAEMNASVHPHGN